MKRPRFALPTPMVIRDRGSTTLATDGIGLPAAPVRVVSDPPLSRPSPDHFEGGATGPHERNLEPRKYGSGRMRSKLGCCPGCRSRCWTRGMTRRGKRALSKSAGGSASDRPTGTSTLPGRRPADGRLLNLNQRAEQRPCGAAPPGTGFSRGVWPLRRTRRLAGGRRPGRAEIGGPATPTGTPFAKELIGVRQADDCRSILDALVPVRQAI
jgi:hypothetical protein